MYTANRKIQRLSSSLISQIAAGEVVEKPASVIKELVENALDAGATQIIITANKGGKTFISVLDNGMGMDKSDAILSIERHATSKVYTANELAIVTSRGFRGEALAAISSVSQFELTTCRDESKGGTQIIINGLDKPVIRSFGFPKGTKVTVSNLFYNLPARKKFLKSEQTEYYHITKFITNIALSNPATQFRFIHNQKIILDYPATTDLQERIRQCWGALGENQLFFCEHKEAYLSFKGWFSVPPLARKTREWQHISVNQRQIKDKYISNAIYAAYKTLLMKQMHPLFAIDITILPGEMDANVHPAKTEIRLKNPKLVQLIITERLQKELKQATRSKIIATESITYDEESILYSYIQDQDAPSEEQAQEQVAPNKEQEQVATNKEQAQATDLPILGKKQEQADPFMLRESSDVAQSDLLQDSDLVLANLNSTQTAFPLPRSIKKETTFKQRQDATKEQDLFSFQPVVNVKTNLTNSQEQSPFQVIGQWLNRYILATKDSTFLLFDQHATHERILFEKIRYEFYNQEITSETLLIPLEITLLPHTSILLEKYEDEWQKFGFSFEHKHANIFKVTRMPAILKEKDIVSIVQEILNEIGRLSKSNMLEIFFNQVIESMACHSAIRSGDSLSQEKMQILLNSLHTLDLNVYCPHGRPVFVEITEKEIDQRFKRII